jgi:hypothetical protein
MGHAILVLQISGAESNISATIFAADHAHRFARVRESPETRRPGPKTNFF